MIKLDATALIEVIISQERIIVTDPKSWVDLNLVRDTIQRFAPSVRVAELIAFPDLSPEEKDKFIRADQSLDALIQFIQMLQDEAITEVITNVEVAELDRLYQQSDDRKTREGRGEL
jgi:hypothetical protein